MHISNGKILMKARISLPITGHQMVVVFLDCAQFLQWLRVLASRTLFAY